MYSYWLNINKGFIKGQVKWEMWSNELGHYGMYVPQCYY